ncbi:MAG: restriction endonuclease, partial [Anaerolineae bacterium]|nr:restriction endonuclease [Anaerolineae bacterium]
RCLYGVDKNPLAVEMAKLSLWLITLDRNRPFTFLDHALKCGDSLVGADEDMFLRWAHGLRDSAVTLFDETLGQQLETARAKRRELESFEVREVRDAERKAALLAEAEAAMARVKLGCDLLVGTQLLGLKPKEVEARLSTLLLEYFAKGQPDSAEAREAVNAARKVRAFHWPFGFPEVFERGGFGAFVGNPPFLGGGRISTMLGDDYFGYLRSAYLAAHGQADLCAFFFRRAFALVGHGSGAIGLIATNTIAQADTRETGLDHLLAQGGQIYRAETSTPWPGMAAVYVSVVYILRGQFEGAKFLNNIQVLTISAYLDDTSQTGTPRALQENAGKAFRGVDVLGMGFIMEPEAARDLIERDQRNADVLFPYITVQDFNSRPDQSPSRWVINFFDWPLDRQAIGSWASASNPERSRWLSTGSVPADFPGKVAADYPDCLRIVREKVYPERLANPNKQRREIWWRFTRPRVELLQELSLLRRVLLRTRVTQTHAFAFVPSNIIYSDVTVVFSFDDGGNFALLQSSIHEVWAWTYGSTLKSDLRYSPSDCFETFPMPLGQAIRSLRSIGDAYHEHRRCTIEARNEGLTAIFNRFHDPDERNADIAHLRELHVEMDKAVAAAYGWEDLDLGHGFHETPQGTRFTLSKAARREVLARLLRLNHEQYEAEVAAGLHEKKGSKDNVGSKGRGTQTKGTLGKGKKKQREGGEQLGML